MSIPRHLRHRMAASSQWKARRQKPLTRSEARAWLAPIRAAFNEMRQGEVNAIRGYAVTRIDHTDEWARVDYCIAGFRAMMSRLMPDLSVQPMGVVEKKLAAGVPLTMAELDACMALFKVCENRLITFKKQDVIDAALTEQVNIEVERLGLQTEQARGLASQAEAIQ